MRKLLLPLAFAVLVGSCRGEYDLPEVDFWVKDDASALEKTLAVVNKEPSKPENSGTIKELSSVKGLISEQQCKEFMTTLYQNNGSCFEPSKEVSPLCKARQSVLDDLLKGCEEERVIPPDISRECIFSWRGLSNYKAWIRQGIEDSRKGRKVMIVDKVAHTLDLYLNGKKVVSYVVGFGHDPYGDKQKEGDQRTPEGIYTATVYDSNHPKYYKAIGVGYPNARNWRNFQRLKKEGVLDSWDTIGGLIRLHSSKTNYDRGSNWTTGCMFLVREDIDDLVRRINPGHNLAALEFVIVRYSSYEEARKYNCK